MSRTQQPCPPAWRRGRQRRPARRLRHRRARRRHRVHRRRPPAAEAGGLIAVITPSHDNPFFKAEADAAVAKAEELGYETTPARTTTTRTSSRELIDSAISTGAQAIILDNAGADVTIGAVQKAIDAGIPVFLIDREINQTGIATAQIVANNSQGAGPRRRGVRQALGRRGHLRRADRQGVRHQRGRPLRGLRQRDLDQYPDLQLVAQETANWDQQEAFTKTETHAAEQPRHQGHHRRQRHHGARRRRRGRRRRPDRPDHRGRLRRQPRRRPGHQGRQAARDRSAAGRPDRRARGRAGRRVHQHRRDQPAGEAVDRLRADQRGQRGRYTLFALS